VLIDAAGTLLHPAEPVARTYRRFASPYGETPPESEIAKRVRAAMARHRNARVGDERWYRYWGLVVEDATGCSSPTLLEELWEHFGRAEAWTLAPGAEQFCRDAKAAGIRLAVVSNFDTRLRPLLRALGVATWFDAIVVSAEEGVEKPDPRIFEMACRRLGVEPSRCLMVGDSSSDDVEGARAAGLGAVLLGVDVTGFEELRHRLHLEHVGDDIVGP
jgi:REG-2-like HAD superfamily hydrolase